MGSWNHTCFLSNLSIGAGTDMALMTLVQTKDEMGSCRPTEYYYPAPVMIYGEYDDYGGMENCYGSEIGYLLKEFVDGNTLDENADAEKFSRLGDQGSLHFVDKNAFHQKLKGNANAKVRVQQVAINLRILNRLLDEYYFTDYHILKDPTKTPSSPNNYVPINYKFLCDSIPAYIARLKNHLGEDNSMIIWEPIPDPDWKDPDILGKWLHSFSKDVGYDFFRKSYIDRLQILARNDEDEELTSCLQEFCKYMMIYSYMNYSRRVYIRPQCSSQEIDPIAHKIMAEITLAEIEQQRKEWEEEDYPDDMWDPKYEIYMEQCELTF